MLKHTASNHLFGLYRNKWALMGSSHCVILGLIQNQAFFFPFLSGRWTDGHAFLHSAKRNRLVWDNDLLVPTLPNKNAKRTNRYLYLKRLTVTEVFFFFFFNVLISTHPACKPRPLPRSSHVHIQTWLTGHCEVNGEFCGSVNKNDPCMSLI